MKYAIVTNRDGAAPTSLEGDLHWITDPTSLTADLLEGARYVFFPFWSHKVPKEITDKYECVCFHMTDVPYGRGGSPLQNLILRGHTETVISALRMTQEMDAGPVYMKWPLSLEGSAQEIYERAAVIIADMMRVIADKEPTPVPQKGEVVEFKRREPEQSSIGSGLSPRSSVCDLHDFIRMLDADGYPRAFIQYHQYRITFSNARLEGDRVIATAVIE